MIVQRLYEIQRRHGFLPDQELEQLARDLEVPLHRVEEVSSSFPAFRLGRVGPPAVEVRVCRDMACHRRGAAALLDRRIGLPAVAAELAAAGHSVDVDGTSCLGRCDRAPVARMARFGPGAEGPARVFAGRSPDELRGLVRRFVTEPLGPTGDTDAGYHPHTNADHRYAPPAVGAPGTGPPALTPGWSLDVYARSNWPRDYRGARRCAEFVRLAGGAIAAPPPDLTGAERDARIRESNPLLWELRAAGLLGMGGAGMPVYQKWLDVWQQPGNEKFVVCNGSEAEPGQFKDRELLLRAPHLVVEGLILAGLMVGATAGYIAVRYEYDEQIAAVRDEVQRAERLGACGENVFGTGRDFPVEVVELPGGYICGEQSALLEVLEDRRALPRNRPPELTAVGLRGRPTAVNNVETLARVPGAILQGAEAVRAGGWQPPAEPAVRFEGRRLLSVSGDVNRPGVYEVPNGLPLGRLLDDPLYCAGVAGGRALRAVALSGAAGGFTPARLPVPPRFDAEKRAAAVQQIAVRSPDDAAAMDWFLRAHLPHGATHLDLRAVPLDLNFFRHMNGVFRLPAELMLGPGLVVYAGDADVLDAAVNVTEFYQRESCGKCLPCRLGTRQLAALGTELLASRTTGAGTDPRETKAAVNDLMLALQLTSICGLGYVAPIPLASALAYFPTDANPAPAATPTAGEQ